MPPSVDCSHTRLLVRLLSEAMCMWCPSLQEVTEAFYSLGALSPAVYHVGPCQHSRESDASLSWSEQQNTPLETALDISLNYIYKVLTLGALDQPGAYISGNLLGLIELLC
ncbi:hypothetical protein MUG91_G242n34 [Manis pentadactyla]|nr:hypothetical protein MUG91_G242n34 [Manis pentadactyla]